MPAHMTVRGYPKPAKGSARKAQRSRRRAIETRETRAKALARERDEYRCRRCGVGPWPESPWPMLEAAHIIDKGMGGDHGKYSHLPKHFVTLCHDCHQGPRSLHSGDVAMAWHPEHMGDGRVTFIDVERKR